MPERVLYKIQTLRVKRQQVDILKAKNMAHAITGYADTDRLRGSASLQPRIKWNFHYSHNMAQVITGYVD